MYALARNLVFALADEPVAHLVEHGQHDIIEQMVALYIQIGGVGSDSETLQVVFHTQITLLGIGMAVAQIFHLAPHLATQPGERLLPSAETEVAKLDDVVKIGDGKLAVMGCAVEPDAPHKKGENGLGVEPEKLGKVEDGVVVECHGHAHVVERRAIALVVLDGVDIAVEHVGIGYHLVRSGRGPLHEIVVVGIYTGYQVVAGLAFEQIHQHRFLAALEFARTRGQHHLKIACVVFKTTEHRAPEEHVVIALHVGDDFAARPLRVQFVGRLEIAGSDIVSQSFTHIRSPPSAKNSVCVATRCR